MTTAPEPSAQGGQRPSRSRGVIALHEQNCTVCMLCVRECPDWCIEIDSHVERQEAQGPGGRPRTVHVLDRFDIDYGLCMYCGICVEVCPFEALFWAPDTDYSAQAPQDLVHGKERLGEWLGHAPGAPPVLEEPSGEG